MAKGEKEGGFDRDHGWNLNEYIKGTYRIVLPVRRRIHCGIGRFCFCALASFCFVRKDLWDYELMIVLVVETLSGCILVFGDRRGGKVFQEMVVAEECVCRLWVVLVCVCVYVCVFLCVREEPFQTYRHLCNKRPAPLWIEMRLAVVVALVVYSTRQDW